MSRPVFIEGLEERRLLSVSLHDGLLRVAGRRSLGDKVTVFLNKSNPGKLDVKLNNVVTEYDLSAVTSIRIDGYGGNDRIGIYQTNGAIIRGGQGNDDFGFDDHGMDDANDEFDDHGSDDDGDNHHGGRDDHDFGDDHGGGGGDDGSGHG